MPQIILKQLGQNSANFAVNGAVITVAGITVNCEDREEDVMKIIEIRQNDGGVQEGGKGAFLAQIEIPARSYVDENGPSSIVRNPVPFDPNRVILTLWPTN